jgi:hypothetical protein
VSGLTLPELKELCRERGLKGAGAKIDVVARLLAYRPGEPIPAKERGRKRARSAADGGGGGAGDGEAASAKKRKPYECRAHAPARAAID